MKKEKMSFKNIKDVLSRGEMRQIMAGSGNDCPSGEFPCTCNGTDYGCVSSVNECWNKC